MGQVNSTTKLEIIDRKVAEQPETRIGRIKKKNYSSKYYFSKFFKCLEGKFVFFS